MQTLRKSMGLTHANPRGSYAKVALRKFVGCVGPYRDPPTYVRSHELEDLRANPRSICSKTRWVVHVGAPKATGERMCVVQQANGSGGGPMGDRARLPNRREQDLQRALADHLRAREQPSVYWFHAANGGARSAIEGATLKACSVRAGTPDIICIKDGRTSVSKLPTVASAKPGVSPTTKCGKPALNVAVAIGLDDAIVQLERWHLLRG